eukprot:TRINITY_DN10327_c0_g1_i1.p1 TRINITY_DN10327_c0_g1~~TRINITY_DN10327_c0_g1_i1.p1  ORF type:complete len:364 (-),score=31.46 TRINITY_DN10327_c0_g1_i1:487-1578(-)
MVKDDDYVYQVPDVPWKNHFSNLLFSSDILSTGLELALYGGLTLLAWLYPDEMNVTGSMPLLELATFMWIFSFQRRIYNAYLESVFFAFPAYRTQPVKEHALKSRKDLVGREPEQLKTIIVHDRLTLTSQFALDVAIYYLIPGYYPAKQSEYQPMYIRILMLILNHYVMSFGMYWTHRALHVNPYGWRYIHSFHHWAKHPLSRTTYQDHWFDNFGNAIVGHMFAQILVPLDNQFFWISRSLRICESLEKHSGVSCSFNLVHALQRYFPYAQMPHHHDWHHEGHKGCNYTFTSIGGLWDCVFGTRKTGRHPSLAQTKKDQEMAQGAQKTNMHSLMNHPWLSLTPVLMVATMAITKLNMRPLAAY